jgi:hypothetical protein
MPRWQTRLGKPSNLIAAGTRTMIEIRREYKIYGLAQLAALIIGILLGESLSQLAIVINVAVDGLLFGVLAYGLADQFRTLRDACALRLGGFWLFASVLVTLKYTTSMGNFGIGFLFYFLAYAFLLGGVLAITVGLSLWRGASRA